MNTISALRTGFYHVPLPVTLTDSTHGEMTFFELVTVRLVDSDGAEGIGYTYTVGAGGGAMRDLIERDLKPRLIGQPAADIEALWQRMWWTLHYGGRGGQASSAISAMREHLGADSPLMADANMRWSVDQAIQAARALQPCSLVWLEEPTIPDDVHGHARILREGGVPIATGENLHTLHEFAHFIRAEAVAFPEPDVTNCGGVTVFMKVAHLAEAFNLPVTSHGAHDITVHLLAAVPNRSYLEAHGFGLERYLAHPLAIVDGNAIAPERPGHGVEFDWDALEALQVR